MAVQKMHKKKPLGQVEKQIESLAKFPNQNPFPVLRLAGDGTILYSNTPGQVLLDEWRCGVGDQAPKKWQSLIKTAIASNRHLVEEISWGEKLFSITIVPIPGEDYVNLYGRDITAIRQNEDKLRLQAQIIEQVHDSVITTDLDGIVTGWNKGSEQLFGYSAEEARGQSIAFLYPPDRRDIPLQKMAPLLKQKGYLELEERVLKKSGQPADIHLSLSILKDKNGDAVGMISYSIDITERKSAEEALRGSEQRMQMALQLSRSFAFEWDTATDRVLRSDSCAGILGLSGEEAEHDTGQRYFQRVHPDDRDRFVRMLGELKPAADTYHTEYRVLRGDGTTVILEESAQAFFGADGTLCRVMGFSIDITARKQAEEETVRLLQMIREEKDRLSALINSIRDEVWFADTQKQFTLANPSAVKEFGVGSGNGIDVENLAAGLEVYRPDGSPRPVEEAPPLRALQGEVIKDLEEIVRIPATGQLHHRQVSAAPVRGADGTIIGSVSVVRDITERKQAEERAKKEYHETALINRVLRVFVEESDDTLFDKALAIIQESMASRHGVFGYISEPGHLLCPSLSKMLDACEIEGKCIHYPPGKWKGLWARALKEKRSLYTNAAPPVPPGHPIIHNNLAAPILFQGEAIGLLNLANKDGGYTEQDKEILDSIAARVAPMLYAWIQRTLREDERKQAEAALRGAHDELEQRVKERTTQLNQTVETLEDEVRQRIAVEKNVQSERKRFEDVLEMMPAYAILLKPDYHVAYANRTFRDWFGDGNGKKCYEFLFRRTEPCEDCQTYTVLKTGKSHFWEWTGPNGHNYDIYDYPFTDTDGSPLIMEIGVDVTAHKQTQKAVKEGEERYHSLIVATSQIVWTTDPQGQVIADMPSWRAFTGQTIEEIQGWGWIHSLHPDDRQRTSEIWSRCVQNKMIYQTEYRIRRHDGQYRYMSVCGVPVLEQDGTIREWVGTCTDISEHKQAESRIELTNVLLELFTKKTARKEYLDAVVEQIHAWSGCHSIGIRLADADGWLPYESCIGFSEEFLATENRLSLNNDDCLCIRAITQRTHLSDASLVTQRGSFCSGNTFAFLNTLSAEEKSCYRGTCLRHGFASLAVIPIRYREHIVGTIHLADQRQNQTPAELIEFLEHTAMLIGEAVHRFDVEESLRQSQGRLLEAQRIAHLGNWEWDIVSGRLLWSDEVYHIFGLVPQQSEATYETFLSCVHPDDRARVDRAVQTALNGVKEYSIDHRILRPDGSERVVHEKAEVTYDAQHTPIRMAGTVHDITERRLAEDAIRENQSQLRHLGAELQRAEEQERRRLAQDLHDSVGQILAFSSREIKRLRKSSPDEIVPLLTEISSQLDKATTQTRTLSFDLSPSILYDLGFEVAVEDLADRFARERNIQCRFENCPSAKPLADTIKVFLYRAIRELIINVAKHAEASEITIGLQRQGPNIRVIVEDNGKGFDMFAEQEASGRPKGFGLFNIRERLTHIGGRFEIESAKGRGTRVILTAPLNLEEQIGEPQ